MLQLSRHGLDSRTRDRNYGMLKCPKQVVSAISLSQLSSPDQIVDGSGNSHLDRTRLSVTV
jgi:hypothetical protein